MTRSATPPMRELPHTPLAEVAAGIDTCVHCGFCLQACPTYLALEDENDSPRGRILLMRALLEGTLGPDDPSVQTHIDRCLGCRACETACPSGVPYGQLLEATRATLAVTRPLPAIARFVLFVFSRPALLHLAMLGARLLRASRLPHLLARLPGRLGFACAMLESTRDRLPRRAYEPRAGPARERVAPLRGCVMDGLYRGTNRATRRALTVNGYQPVEAPGQGCCGALHAHSGDLDGARRLARRNIEAFERSKADLIVANASGCSAILKEYGVLLAHDAQWAERAAALSARVREVSELLAAAGPVPGAPLPLRITYDAPCHMLHAQRIVEPPLRMLAAIPSLEVVPLEDADQCCGSAGIYNLIEPETSDRVLAPKLAHIAATNAAWVATGNPGCLMQIGAGLRRAGSPTRVIHPVDLLDASYAGAAP